MYHKRVSHVRMGRHLVCSQLVFEDVCDPGVCCRGLELEFRGCPPVGGVTAGTGEVGQGASLSTHPAAAPNLVPRQKWAPPQHTTQKAPERQLFRSRPLPPHIGCLARRGPSWHHQLQRSAALRRPQSLALELPSELPSPAHTALSQRNLGLLRLINADMVAVYWAGVASLSSG